MNKKMDVNFAFAILLLVAAIVGMYFWLDSANYDMGDIYREDQTVKMAPRATTDTVPAGAVEGALEDPAMLNK